MLTMATIEDVPVIIGISAIAAGEVSVDPENLRFQYELSEDLEPTPAAKSSKRQKPVVYREQVGNISIT